MPVSGANEIWPARLLDNGGATFNALHPDFGTVGDGTTDDQAALQLAINAAQTVKGVLVIPPRATSYRVRSKLSITAPLTIRAYGATILFDFPVGTSNANGGLFTVTSSNVTIEGLTIDGGSIAGTITSVNRYGIIADYAGGARLADITVRDCRFINMVQYSGTIPTTSTVMHAIYLRGVDRPTVEGNYFNTLSGAGLYLLATAGARVRRNDFSAFGWSGITVHDSNYDWTITHNRFVGGVSIAAPSYWGGAIDVLSQTPDQIAPGLPNERGYIGANHFDGGIYRYGQVLRLASARDVLVEGNIFDRCDAENSSTPSTSPGGGAAGAHNNLMQCTVRDVGVGNNNGPHKNITIRGNTFRAFGAGYQKAIHIITTSGSNNNTTPCEGTIIEGNQFVSPDSSNYFLSNICLHGFVAGYKDLIIRGNRFKGKPSASNYMPGNVPGLILLMSNAGKTVSDVNITGNLFEYDDGAGGVGTTNTQTAINIQPDVTKLSTQGNGFKNFGRAVLLDASNTGDILLPVNNVFTQSGAPNQIGWRGTNFKPAYSTGISLRVTADQTITSTTTLANVTELAFPIAASEEWHATVTLDVGGALSTTGLKVAVTVPAGATLNVVASLQPDVITAANTVTKRTATSGTALDFTAATQVGVANAQIKLDIWVLNSTTAGTVQLQAAQSTSSGTAVVVRKGSALVAERIA